MWTCPCNGVLNSQNNAHELPITHRWSEYTYADEANAPSAPVLNSFALYSFAVLFGVAHLSTACLSVSRVAYLSVDEPVWYTQVGEDSGDSRDDLKPMKRWLAFVVVFFRPNRKPVQGRLRVLRQESWRERTVMPKNGEWRKQELLVQHLRNSGLWCMQLYIHHSSFWLTYSAKLGNCTAVCLSQVDVTFYTPLYIVAVRSQCYSLYRARRLARDRQYHHSILLSLLRLGFWIDFTRTHGSE